MKTLLLLAVSFFLRCVVCAEPIGPEKGSLLIIGGGRMTKEMVTRFIELAGGIDAAFVIVPSANEGEKWDADYVAKSFLARAGAKDVTVLHTRDRAVADTEEFVAPLLRARGVWFDGGRQWRLVDSYLHTRTHRAFEGVLARGGVIGGSSAGATIQGSYLVRGAPEGNTIMMAKGHEEGLGFLKGSAIDQHVLARHRENDLAPVIEAHPELLGIGLDEGTAIVVQGDWFEVIGESKVVVHRRGRPFFLMAPGEWFDLKAREKIGK